MVEQNDRVSDREWAVAELRVARYTMSLRGNKLQEGRVYGREGQWRRASVLNDRCATHIPDAMQAAIVDPVAPV